jgi:hypothetical protein
MALKMHHTEILGRKINVEATAGGGGKSEVRVKKIKEKNSKLHDQRVMHLEICSNYLQKKHFAAKVEPKLKKKEKAKSGEAVPSEVGQ